MRRVITGIALAALTLATLVPGSPAHAATTGPTLTIDTPGPFEDLQSVTMTGAGLTPGETLWFMECQRWANLCTYWSGVSGTVEPSGRLTISATVHRFIHEYMYIPPPIDCAYDDCGFALVRQGDYEDGYDVVAKTVGRFARTDSTSRSATIEAPAPLPAVVSTHVLGRGFTPGSRVAASRCVSTPADAPGPATDSCDEQESSTADAHGEVAVPIELRRVGVGGIDCVDPDRVCSVRLDGPEYAATARVALVFDPTSFPPPPPTISVAPQPVRHVAATVTVTGRGFRPDHDVFVGGPGSDGASTTATADANGAFTTTLAVHRYAMARATSDPDPVVDCATAGACTITATTGPDDASASAPIVFAAHSDDPTLVLDGATVREGNGTTNASFRVHLDRPASAPVTFWYFHTYGSTPGDLALGYAFGTEEIPAGRTELSVPIVLHGNRLDEPDQHPEFTVMELTGAQLAGPPSIPMTILDDDPRPQVDIAATVAGEGAGHATIPVRLSAVSGRDVTVTYRTHHASARSGSDFVRTTGSVRIPAGSHITQIRIRIVDDHRAEPGERFWIELTGAHNGVLRTDQADVWIGDDDG